MFDKRMKDCPTDGYLVRQVESMIYSNESFSACLLVMDAHFRLYEWLAYHYHVLKLRYVVMGVDASCIITVARTSLGFVPERAQYDNHHMDR